MAKAHQGNTRDKERTKERLIDAVVSIIRERGYEDVGVNAVAEQAGVSKVLIYRYFGDLEGLYRAAADRLDPLQSGAADRLFEQVEASFSSIEAMDTSMVVRRTILDMHMALKHDELSKNLLIWELSHSNSITKAFSQAREETGLDLTEKYRHLLEAQSGTVPKDLNALLALITAGVFYLTLRSDAVDKFNGIDIGSEEGWNRIADAVAEIISSQEGLYF